MSEPATGRRSGLDVASLRAALSQGTAIADEAFDALYPATQRHRSEVHWTPVDVALQVSAWLACAPGGNILDVGSGVGKMCHVGALASDARWTGVERDARMVRIASRIARELSVETRTRFVHGEALQLDWSAFGGVYLFNPFSEAVFADTPPDPLLRQAAYIEEVLRVERMLLTLQPGARVVTYHGFGGEMPAVFEMAERVEVHAGTVCLWIRQEAATS